jgi:hypothetical protein
LWSRVGELVGCPGNGDTRGHEIAFHFDRLAVDAGTQFLCDQLLPAHQARRDHRPDSGGPLAKPVEVGGYRFGVCGLGPFQPLCPRVDVRELGGRYNTANGRLAGMTTDVGAERYEIGGGWFLTQSVLLKAEYVNQKYNDFPTLDIRNGGKFNGLMFEGVVAF